MSNHRFPRSSYGSRSSFAETSYKSTQSGLPVRLDANAYMRIKAGLASRQQVTEVCEKSTQLTVTPVTKQAQSSMQIRVASLRELPGDFAPLGGGFYRQGHVIWELRGAEDEEGGYVLTRKREERAVDLRGYSVERTASIQKVSHVTNVAPSRCPSCLWAGQRVAFVKSGQVLPVIVIEMPLDGDTKAKVEDEVGQQMMAPLDMIVTDMTVRAPSMATSNPAGCACQEECPCFCHCDQDVKRGPVEGMNPEIEPSSKDEDAQIDEGFDSMLLREKEAAISGDHMDLWGRWVTPTKVFSPQYMGGSFVFDPDNHEIYEVEGLHRADPTLDRQYEVPNPMLPHPNALSREWYLNDRIRLRPYDGGALIFVAPMELNRNFDAISDVTSTQYTELDPVMEMPGELAMRPVWNDEPEPEPELEPKSEPSSNWPVRDNKPKLELESDPQVTRVMRRG